MAKTPEHTLEKNPRPPARTLGLTLKDGRPVSVEVPLKPGTYEHLDPNALFEVATFIRLKSLRSEHTRRAYTTQLEKFLLWMRHAQIQTIDEWALMDYQRVLLDPPPALREQDRVTFNACSEETADYYLDILRGFVRHLHEKNLLPYNPAKHVPAISVRNKHALDERKHFADAQWAAVLATLEALPEHAPGQRNKKERLRFCIRFQYAMALRIREMAAHTHQDIVPQDDVWRLKLIGKGKRARNLTLDAFAIEALTRYRKFLGLPPLPQGEPLPLLPTVHPVTIKTRGPNPGVLIKTKPITPSNWQNLFNQFIEHDVMRYLYGEAAQRKQHTYREQWQRFSPHALRHTRITHLVEREHKDLLWVQKFAGHENLNTTGGYFHVAI